MSHCSICISSCTDPVSLPCGHIYCRLCIASYATTHRTALTAKCPKCRDAFHLVTPDLAHLAPKFHPFVTPPVRRVYIDNAEQTRLEQKVQELEKRVVFKTDTDKSLMERYEALAATVDGHRQGERDANNRIMELEQVIRDLEDGQAEQVMHQAAEIKGYRKQVAQLAASNMALVRNNDDLKSKVSRSRKQFEKHESDKEGLQKRIEELTVLTSLLYPGGNTLFDSALGHLEAIANCDIQPWDALSQPICLPTQIYLTSKHVATDEKQTGSSARQSFY